MNPEELSEQAEHAHHTGQKAIGLTTAITAVLLAVATLLGHRAHTEEVVLQSKVNDQWSFYQAKHQRAHIYGVDAEIAEVQGHHAQALEFMAYSLDEECGTPAEKGCNPPRVKQSPVLRQLTEELKRSEPSADGDEAPGAAPEAESKAQKTSGHEKPAAEAGGARDSAKKIQDRAREMERDTDVIRKRADRFDASELFLEISIVLCSISLLAENKIYWRISFITSAIGIAIAVYGLLLH